MCARCKFYCCCRYRLLPLCWRCFCSYYHTTHYTLLLLFLQRCVLSSLLFFISAALCLAFWAVIRSLVKSFILPSMPLARRSYSPQPRLVVVCCAKSRLANRFINGNKIIKKKSDGGNGVSLPPTGHENFPIYFFTLCPLVFNSIAWPVVACVYGYVYVVF